MIEAPSEGIEIAQTEPNWDGDGTDLHTFLSQFSGGTHQFVLFRIHPTSFVIRGCARKVSGHLETFSEPPTLETIRDVFGGGRFEVRVMGPVKNQKGHRILVSRKFEIAGDPKLKPESLVDDDPAPVVPTGDSEFARSIIDQMREDKRRLEQTLDRERQMRQEDRSIAERLENKIAAMDSNSRSKVESLSRDVDRKDRDVALLRQQIEAQKPAISDGELIKLTFARAADDTARLMETQRAELQAERERNAREIAAMNDRHAREIASLHERASRELDVARRDRDEAIQMHDRMHRTETETLRSSYAQLLVSKEAEIARLSDSLREIRAVKDRDVVDQVNYVRQLKGALDGFEPPPAPAPAPADDTPAWVRLLEPGSTISEAVGRLLSNVAAAQQQAVAQQQ